MIRWWRLEKVHRGLMTRSWGQPTSRGTLGVFCASVAAAAIFTVFRSFPSSDLSRHCRIYPNDGRTDGRTDGRLLQTGLGDDDDDDERRTDLAARSVGQVTCSSLPPSQVFTSRAVFPSPVHLHPSGCFPRPRYRDPREREFSQLHLCNSKEYILALTFFSA